MQKESSQNFRFVLQSEFVRRCKRNPHYSMRAFAKFLEIDQSLLSKIMRNQRKLSHENITKLGGRLGLKPSVLTTGSFHPLSDDQFEAISEWYHFAILELIKTKSFQSTPEFVARRLGLHIDEARAALERLERLKMIIREKKAWRVSQDGSSWSNLRTTSEARRLLQRRLLEKSLEAIDQIPFELRENGSLTVAIDRKRLPEFKEKLRQIRQELGSFFQPCSPASELNEVYQFTVSFFPLTDQRKVLK